MTQARQRRCLVLGGGGTKGIYHIGVWRALREMGIEVDAFVGTSIGALVAGFLAQGAYDSMEEIGRSISLGHIIALPDDLLQDGGFRLDSSAAARELLDMIRERRGLDTDPLRRLLAAHLDEEKIRAFGKDLGVVTVRLGDLSPLEIFLDDMEPGSLIDYLMASATLPGFETVTIRGRKYIDGGIRDNVPFQMAKSRGYRHIIVSDVSGLGRTRRPQIEGTRTVYIKNSIDMGSVLDFDRDFLDSFLQLGYLDTLRVYGKLDGHLYFLEPDPQAEAHAARACGAGAETHESSIPASLRAILPDYLRHDPRTFSAAMECAAFSLGVPRVRRYRLEELRAEIDAHRLRAEAGIEQARARSGLTTLAPALREAVTGHRYPECPYYYYRLIREAFPRRAANILHRALVLHFPELPAGVEFLERHCARPRGGAYS